MVDADSVAVVGLGMGDAEGDAETAPEEPVEASDFAI
jgi:hypothetical protein